MAPEVTFLFVMMMVVSGLGAMLAYLVSRAFGCITDHESRIRRLEERAHDFAAQESWDSEEAN
jgi:hypothetical protein